MQYLEIPREILTCGEYVQNVQRKATAEMLLQSLLQLLS